MNKDSSGAHGIKWGLIIGLAYALLLYLRYAVGSNNVVLFGLFTIVGFIAVLVLLLVSGFQFRKQNGGFVEMKELFKTLFIAVLIFEAFYALFTFVYLKYVDPEFFAKLRNSSETLLISAGQPQPEIDKTLANIDKMSESSKNVNVFDVLKSYLYAVGITGLFALLFAFIIKRQPPVFDNNSLQN